MDNWTKADDVNGDSLSITAIVMIIMTFIMIGMMTKRNNIR